MGAYPVSGRLVRLLLIALTRDSDLSNNQCKALSILAKDKANFQVD